VQTRTNRPAPFLRSRLVADRPRLLARQAGKRHPPQYTSSTAAAMHGEPEAITEEEQAQISLQARAKFADERAEQNARRDAKLWAERLRRVELRARSKGVDVYRYQLEVRRAITEMEQATE
jgi:hypothetical protein